MRDQVTIVLNEREPTKMRAAEALEKSLRDLGITASRMNVTEAIEEAVVERCPRIAVLDYLLGDFSTGLDVLARLRTLPEEERPAVFFLTDEPSVSVAVEAMQLGTLDYFALDHPQSIQKLTVAIERTLRSTAPGRSVRTTRDDAGRPRTIDDLVAESSTSRRAIQQLKVLADEKIPVLIVCGAPGTGKQTWARAYRTLRSEDGIHTQVDLRVSTATAAEITGHHPRRSGPRLGEDLCLTLLHIEEDDGELLELIAEKAPIWWGESADSFLVCCTSSTSTAAAWASLIKGSRVLSLPTLAERSDCVPSLVQRFVSDASAISGEKLKPFDANTLRWMSGLDWTDNIRQLRAVTIESALRIAGDRVESPQEIIEQQRLLWHTEHAAHPVPSQESPLLLAQALELCGHRYRAAAAFIGCSTRSLLTRVSAVRREVP